MRSIPATPKLCPPSPRSADSALLAAFDRWEAEPDRLTDAPHPEEFHSAEKLLAELPATTTEGALAKLTLAAERAWDFAAVADPESIINKTLRSLEETPPPGSISRMFLVMANGVREAVELGAVQQQALHRLRDQFGGIDLLLARTEAARPTPKSAPLSADHAERAKAALSKLTADEAQQYVDALVLFAFANRILAAWEFHADINPIAARFLADFREKVGCGVTGSPLRRDVNQ